MKKILRLGLIILFSTVMFVRLVGTHFAIIIGNDISGIFLKDSATLFELGVDFIMWVGLVIIFSYVERKEHESH